MNTTKISAEVVAHSISPQGGELISVLCTFPATILAEINTHEMFRKSPSFLKDIPFDKILKVVQNDPFIPIAWQKDHKDLQKIEYFTDMVNDIPHLNRMWLSARDNAIETSKYLNNCFENEDGSVEGVTNQLCITLLEPFMWTTMLITGSKESWDNFFNLRNPVYEIGCNTFKSKKEVLDYYSDDPNFPELRKYSDLDWLQINKGQEEIHIMDLAEKIYDAVNESIPKKLQPGEWHIPFEDKISVDDVKDMIIRNLKLKGEDYGELKISDWYDEVQHEKVKISVAMTEKTFSNIIGERNRINYQEMIQLHYNLLSQDPFYSSSLEHCARAMNDEEYYTFIKGKVIFGGIDEGYGIINHEYYPYIFEGQEPKHFIGEPGPNPNNKDRYGWCESYRGFRSYKHLLETKELKL